MTDGVCCRSSARAWPTAAERALRPSFCRDGALGGDCHGGAVLPVPGLLGRDDGVQAGVRMGVVRGEGVLGAGALDVGQLPDRAWAPADLAVRRRYYFAERAAVDRAQP